MLEDYKKMYADSRKGNVYGYLHDGAVTIQIHESMLRDAERGFKGENPVAVSFKSADQLTDSIRGEISYRVIKEITNLGEVILSQPDTFIVHEGVTKVLEEAMISAWSEVVGGGM